MEQRKRLFIASCAALVATAMAFSIGTDTVGPMADDFKLTDQQIGWAIGPGLWGFFASIAIAGALVDMVGIGTVLWFAFAGHLLGTAVIVLVASGPWTLGIGWLMIGLANGLVEATINPLVATVYSDRKTHMLNVLHAWWPGGLVIGGLLALGLTQVMGLDPKTATAETMRLGWRLKMGLVWVPTIIYGILMLGQKFPATERVQSGVSYGDMFKEALRPGFLLLLGCMILTAATELGPDKWVGDLIDKMIHMPGIIILVYTAGLMFVLRSFAGPIVKRISPVGLLILSAILSCVGLYWFSFIETALGAFVAATVFGIGKTFFWPTMLGVTSERFPKGGALLLGMMGGVGMLSVGLIAVPLMGKIQDHYTLANIPAQIQEQVVEKGRVDSEKVKTLPEEQQSSVEQAQKIAASATYKWVSVVPFILIFIFGAMYLRFRAAGGYKAVKISEGGGGPPPKQA
jgi:MFS family permease